LSALSSFPSLPQNKTVSSSPFSRIFIHLEPASSSLFPPISFWHHIYMLAIQSHIQRRQKTVRIFPLILTTADDSLVKSLYPSNDPICVTIAMPFSLGKWEERSWLGLELMHVASYFQELSLQEEQISSLYGSRSGRYRVGQKNNWTLAISYICIQHVEWSGNTSDLHSGDV
jgi:hypothetical protein